MGRGDVGPKAYVARLPVFSTRDHPKMRTMGGKGKKSLPTYLMEAPNFSAWLLLITYKPVVINHNACIFNF